MILLPQVKEDMRHDIYYTLENNAVNERQLDFI